MSAIELREILSDPSRKDVFGFLNECIQPDSATTVSKAAASFTQTVKAQDERFFWGFWNDVFSAAEQIPHDHPAQDKLAVFVRELTLAPETGDTVWDARVWTDLPLLGPSIRERLDREFTAQVKISFHAFVARLLNAGVSPGSETTAIWMLREALEQQQDTKSGDDNSSGDADRALTIAAMYVEYAGATLAQKLALQPEPELDENKKRLLRGGSLWEGKTGLTPDRWAFWGKRFRECGENAKGQEAKELALHAAKLIDVWSKTLLSKS